MVHKQLFINNEYIDATSKETITIYSPHDESVVEDGLQVASLDDVDKAVAAARAALEGEWSKWTPRQRSTVMLKLADLIEQRVSELHQWETKSMGQLPSIGPFIYSNCVESFRYYAGWTDKLAGEAWTEDDKGVYHIVQYEPVGVCAAIGAWNAQPVFFGTKVAPALATGCTVIFKPSEKSPIGVLQIGQLVKEAGFPPGVVNILTGDGKIGAALASHMDIDKISFTGSTFSGNKVQELALKSNMKRVTLELGGKSPSIIFPDANLDIALEKSMYVLTNTGQGCILATRLFVHEDVADKFIKMMKEAFERVTVGSPTDPKTDIGPLADRLQFERVMGFLETGKNEAQLVTGGERHGDAGYYVKPTIYLNPKDDARIYREEIFGPVVAIRTFKTEEEAIKLANDTTYGLASYVFTASVPRALRIARKIKAGNVHINNSHVADSRVPFGGAKRSGLGYEGGLLGLMAYVEARTISINMHA